MAISILDVPDEKIIAYAARIKQPEEQIVSFRLGCDCLGKPEMWVIEVLFSRTPPTVRRTRVK